MNITVTIESPSPEVLAFLGTLSGPSKPARITAKSEKRQVPAPEPQPQQEPQPQPQPQIEAQPEPQPEPVTVTLEQVRAKLAALAQAGKQAQVKDLIMRFGASKLTDIPAEMYPELMAAAEEL